MGSRSARIGTPHVSAFSLQPGHGEAVVLHQMLVEVLDREPGMALAIERLDLLRGPLVRSLAEPTVDKPVLGLLFVTSCPAPERPLPPPRAPPPPPGSALSIASGVEDCKTFPCATPERASLRRIHPPRKVRLTGQILRYLNRTYRVLATQVARRPVARDPMRTWLRVRMRQLSFRRTRGATQVGL